MTVEGNGGISYDILIKPFGILAFHRTKIDLFRFYAQYYHGGL